MTREQFEQAITETPNDDTIKLLFADWLEEQGEPEGELMRLRIEVKRAPYERRAQMYDRIAQLIDPLRHKVTKLIERCAQHAKTLQGRSQIAQWYTYSEFAEPGYAEPANGIIIVGNFNSVTQYDKSLERSVCIDPAPERLASILESLGCDLQWSDEWADCHQCGRLVRTQPDGYDWQPSYRILNDCEIYCAQCFEKEYEGTPESIEDAGEDDGRQAARWVVDTDTTPQQARRMLKWLEDGDDRAPQCPEPLSGEWADDPSIEDIVSSNTSFRAEDLEPEEIDELADRYLQGYSRGWQDELTSILQEYANGEEDDDRQ